jgi:hypothetical protein
MLLNVNSQKDFGEVLNATEAAVFVYNGGLDSFGLKVITEMVGLYPDLLIAAVNSITCQDIIISQGLYGGCFRFYMYKHGHIITQLPLPEVSDTQDVLDKLKYNIF